MSQIEVTAYVNVDSDYWATWEPGMRLATDAELTMVVNAEDPLQAANEIWVIGNRQGKDEAGRTWPSGVRSLSVGDVVVVGETALAVERYGWKQVSLQGVTPGDRAMMVQAGHARATD
jgi:hypothetical protein